MRYWLVLLLGTLSATAQGPSPLWTRGYSVIPTPKNVELLPGDVVLDGSWSADAGSAVSSSIAFRTLVRESSSLHSLVFRQAASGSRAIRLAVKPGTVKTGANPGIDRQGYQLEINNGGIEITANSDPGLLYGVETLLQLAKRDSGGRLTVPACTITDWPDLELRFLHWDTKHHQDRIETLKRFLDWSARFKINVIGFELEDKFSYPSHPVIGAPGAFTPAELQEIVNYGLERYIQVVPQVQAPAHMAYVLKHKEFADLRSDGSNYAACTCDPRSYDLIFSMYDDLIKATKGVNYFFASTDEVYYAGNCALCRRPYNPENRSLAWVEFVQKAHAFLASRGRKMLVWAEFPLLPQHVKLLPEGIIDGIVGRPEFPPLEKERGIRQLAYASMQGAELLFPSHFTMDGETGHLDTAFNDILNGRTRQGDPIGAFGAAWDDSGLHNETFWLGWSAVAQYAWNRGGPGIAQHAAEFMKLYYGPRVTGMVEIYQALQRQARAWERMWDRIPSKVITYRYGSYFGKGIGTHRTDMTLGAPLVNDLPDWFPDPRWSDRYKEWIAEAREHAIENRKLSEAIQAAFAQADQNHYNLEVMAVLARFIGHHWRLFADLEEAETLIREGQGLALEDKPSEAFAQLSAAWKVVDELQQDRRRLLSEMTAVFEKSRYPKGRSVDGREFVHVFDDVKDHFADRRPDLSYMTAPEESIGLDRWNEELAAVIRAYAATVNLPPPNPGR